MAVKSKTSARKFKDADEVETLVPEAPVIAAAELDAPPSFLEKAEPAVARDYAPAERSNQIGRASCRERV